MDNQFYTKEQLVQSLADLYDNPNVEKTAAGGIFIFKYGKYVVDKYTPTELMREAHLLNSNVKERYAAELNGAFLMYRYFQNNPTEFNVSCGLSIQNISELFAAYLKNEGKSEATIDRYVKQVPNNSEVQNVVQSVTGTTVLFDVMDVAKLLQISQKVAAQDFDQKGGNMYSAGINAYTHFISNYCLFVKHIARGNKKTTVQNSNQTNQFPLQQIFYGAPGTGKSNTIKRDVEEQGKIHFRTTFHPDSDYSTFVGCYKPTKEETPPAKQPILDYDTLVDKFKEYLNVANVNITKACTLFGYDYHDSIIEIQNYGKKVLDLVNDAYKSNTSYDSVVRGGMACYESHPTTNNTNSITYQFVPQAFTKAYCEAWNNYNPEGGSEPVFLIIEEINRGNCAQIFGDIFQLLDRKDGFSEYPIDADEDLKKFLLNGTKEDGTPWLVNKDGIKDGKLCLPANLHIWATMNTSDQSLFPIDSAFKRRWDWKYVPINTRKESWNIKVNGAEYSWSDFLEKINAEIDVVTHSEDKKLGFYFCKAENGVISAERFVSKVLFYIYNDVFKDYGFDKDIFNDTDGKLSFGKFYQENGDIQEDKVALFLNNLGVGSTGATEEETDIEYDTADAGKAEHKETLVAVTINGERLTADGMTQFDLYLNAIKKIGVDKVGPALEAMKYRRKGSPMATKNKVQSLLKSDGYSYVEADGYYFVKGAQGYTLVRILEDLNKDLNLNIMIEFR